MIGRELKYENGNLTIEYIHFEEHTVTDADVSRPSTEGYKLIEN